MVIQEVNGGRGGGFSRWFESGERYMHTYRESQEGENKRDREREITFHFECETI